MSKATDLFIYQNSGAVIQSVRGSGFFPSVKMAQMIIESSGKDEKGVFTIGRGLAVRKANNYFGIKADTNWKGKKVALNTPKDGKPVSYFRVYPTVQDSLNDHTAFLLKNPRYTKHGVFQAKSPQEQALALQKAGYSESPTYANALLKIIKAYGLERLDKGLFQSSTGTEKSAVKTTSKNNLLLIGGAAVLAAGTVAWVAYARSPAPKRNAA